MSITAQTKADLKAVCNALHKGHPIEPAIHDRIAKRAKESHLTAQKFDGELSVKLVREIRD